MVIQLRKESVRRAILSTFYSFHFRLITLIAMARYTDLGRNYENYSFNEAGRE